MKKILRFILFTLLLVLIPCTPVFAKTVCKIGSKGYSSLQAAANAVKDGQTIKITKAIKAKDRVELPQKGLHITIDFAKKKYTYTGDNYAFGISPSNTVTIKNLNATGNKLFAVGGTLTLQSGKATCQQLAWTDGNTKASLIIQAGTFTGTDDSHQSFIQNNATTKILNGTFKQGIHMDNRENAQLEISGGFFVSSSETQLIWNNGTVTISGGEFYHTNNMALLRNEGKVTITKGHFRGATALRAGGKSTTIIKGGVFDSIDFEPGSTLEISGGSFMNNITVRGTATLNGGTCRYSVFAQNGGSVTINKFTVNQTMIRPTNPEGGNDPCLICDNGGKMVVKGGSFTAPDGIGYRGNITFQVSGDYKKLFKVKTLTN